MVLSSRGWLREGAKSLLCGSLAENRLKSPRQQCAIPSIRSKPSTLISRRNPTHNTLPKSAVLLVGSTLSIRSSTHLSREVDDMFKKVFLKFFCIRTLKNSLYVLHDLGEAYGVIRRNCIYSCIHSIRM